MWKTSIKFLFVLAFTASGLANIFAGRLILGMLLVGAAILIPAS